MNFIDRFLNRTTMYRLVLYELLTLLLIAGIASAFGLLPFYPTYLAWSVALITIIALAGNTIFAKIFGAPSNPESTYITALILALIISPPSSFMDFHFLSLMFWATIWAVASKYIFAVLNKHLFNPAAFGVAITAFFLLQSATWWIATSVMIPFVLVGGFLITRKIKRFDLVISFLIVSSLAIFIPAISHGVDFTSSITRAFVLVPTIFLATVMLTEPLTTPPTRIKRILYGIVVGALFFPGIHLFGLYATPALALLVGNLFSYLISPKTKLILTLTNRIRLANDVYEFVFTPNRRLAFSSGQYLEWTLPHDAYDNRGIRRYFTIASAPTDKTIRLGAKFYDPASTFKKTLMSLHKGSTLVASQLSGDFVMPRNTHKKLVFIAGGIGITPFISMIRHLIDKNKSRDIVLLYANRTTLDTAYSDILENATAHGVRTVYAFSNEPEASGGIAIINADVIRAQIPDFYERIFYISGPHGMVAGIATTLRTLDVPASHIKADYFPGFA